MKGSSKCSVILGTVPCWCNDYNIVTIEVKVKAVMILPYSAIAGCHRKCFC